MGDKKVPFFRKLNDLVSDLMKLSQDFNRMEEDGDIRLRLDEVKLVTRSLKEIQKISDGITTVNLKFEKIAPKVEVKRSHSVGAQVVKED